jgi:hypothetical protein
MLNGGGRSLEDTRQIRDDEGLREILPLERIPSSDAFGNWLRNMGSTGGLSGLERVNRRLLKRCMKYDGISGYTLDIDATGIEAEKQSAKMTCKGFKGYMPMVGHIAENGLVLGDEFRAGNVAPAARNLTFIKHCVRQLPKGKSITALRSDSALLIKLISSTIVSKRESSLPSEPTWMKRSSVQYGPYPREIGNHTRVVISPRQSIPWKRPNRPSGSS